MGVHVAEASGLIIDAYFSATKLAWLLANIPGLAERARAGEACFGTVDSFLLFKLTGGKVHAMDASNAARTMFYDIRSGDWDERLIDKLGIPRELLPEVRDSQGNFGEAASEHFGAAIPIRGIAGDQQAAAYGQACFAPGMLKATSGTGCFLLANAGERSPRPRACSRPSFIGSRAGAPARSSSNMGRTHAMSSLLNTF